MLNYVQDYRKEATKNENGHFEKRIIHRGHGRAHVIHLYRSVAEFFCWRSAWTKDRLMAAGHVGRDCAADAGSRWLVDADRDIGYRMRFCCRDITFGLEHCQSDFDLKVQKGTRVNVRINEGKKGVCAMKTGSFAKKGLYVGAGMGLIMFAIIGLLPSSFIGGVLGLKIAGQIFGTPLGMELVPRMLVGLSMVLAVLVTGFVFVVGIAITGWLAGTVADTIKAPKTAHVGITVREKK